MTANRAFRTVVLAVVLGKLCDPSVALADDGSVQLEVLSIRATKSSSDISPQLKPLADALKKTFQFTGYKLLGAESRSATLDKKADVALAGPYRAVITPVERKDGRITLKIEVLERKDKKDVSRLSTTISLAAGKSQLFGGWTLDASDVLIIAVGAK